MEAGDSSFEVPKSPATSHANSNGLNGHKTDTNAYECPTMQDKENIHLVEHREVTDIAATGAGTLDGDELSGEELVTSFEDRPSLLKWNPVSMIFTDGGPKE